MQVQFHIFLHFCTRLSFVFLCLIVIFLIYPFEILLAFGGLFPYSLHISYLLFDELLLFAGSICFVGHLWFSYGFNSGKLLNSLPGHCSFNVSIHVY